MSSGAEILKRQLDIEQCLFNVDSASINLRSTWIIGGRVDWPLLEKY